MGPRPTLANRSPPGSSSALLLTIDAGNTDLVFALVEHGVIRRAGGSRPIPRTADDMRYSWLHQLLALEGFTKADNISAAMVTWW